MPMKEQLEELSRLRAQKDTMGGAERLERQRKKGKLDARSRLKLLFDSNTFTEFGRLAGDRGNLPEEDEKDRPSSADGVLTGIGEIEGRPVASAIYDFTVFGGSIGEVGTKSHPPSRSGFEESNSDRLAG
jgi:acetyl-CoA carboxylase carboxyltransferase component